MNNNPFVSICIPVFNGERTIKETIQSVIDQTYKNWELIICDNCSIDNTISIINGFNDKCLILIRNESNIGMINNVKKVIKYAKGDYIKVLCADDIIYETCIEKQVNAFLENSDKNISVITFDIDFIDINDNKLFTNIIPFKKDIVQLKDVLNYMFFTARGSILEPLQMLAKKEDFLNAIISNTNSFSGLRIWCELLYNKNLFVIHETLGAWRLTKGSMSSQLSQIKDQCTIFRDIYLDKRFKISRIQYIFACIVTVVTVLMRRIVFKIYAK